MQMQLGKNEEKFLHTIVNYVTFANKQGIHASPAIVVAQGILSGARRLIHTYRAVRIMLLTHEYSVKYSSDTGSGYKL